MAKSLKNSSWEYYIACFRANSSRLSLNLHIKMSEEQQRRIEDAMLKMFEEVDKACFRQIQLKSLKCAIVCCDDKYSSMLNVQNCIENCNRPLKNAKSLVENEVSYLQNKLQGCILSCDNKVRDKLEPGKDSDLSSYRGEFESCANKCVDSHINNLPDTLKKIKEVLRKEL